MKKTEMTMPWFRLYHEAIDDEKLGLLAFEDRWHFIAILCCKAKGILDSGKIELVRRKLAIKTGLAQHELDEVARRLSDVGLIDKKNFQPIAWEKRQFKSDSSRERTRVYRENMKRHGDVTVTAQEEEEDKDKEEGKKTAPRRKKDGGFSYGKKVPFPPGFYATDVIKQEAERLGFLDDIDEFICHEMKNKCQATGRVYKNWESGALGWLAQEKKFNPHRFREITEFAKMPPGFVYEPPDVEMDERFFD